jgi:large subunit ribosomal protein L25
MPEVVVTKPREGKFNKNAARRVRVAGKIPAVLYGSGHDPVAIEVDPKQISRILFSETGHNTIFDIEVAGQAAAKAMIVDWQREPIKDQLIHIDLKRIALDKALRVKVRVKLAGHSNRREDRRRRSGPGVARGRNRVPACGYPVQYHRRCEQPGDV